MISPSTLKLRVVGVGERVRMLLKASNLWTDSERYPSSLHWATSGYA
jgi:hypothetical protein